MIDESSYASDVADELSLTQSAYAEDVTGEVDLTSAAYAEDVATAINEGGGDDDYTLRVLQYNIGHFNMGYASASSTLISSDKSDGYPSSLDRNYAIQLQRWTDRISGVNADLICMPEWSTYFGYNNGTRVTTANTGIFNGYQLSVGKSVVSGWWINTFASRYAISNAQDIDLGSTTRNVAYVRVGTITLGGKTVKIAVTHINWNHPLGATSDPSYSANAQASYDSRQIEIANLVDLFKNEPYLILCGDFNTEGPVYGPNVSYYPPARDYEAGLDELQPFIDAGFTLANSNANPLLTCIATGSRPDLPARPQYPYCYLDNIITRGFTMSNVMVIDDGTITDHCGVVADLTMI